MNQTSHSKTHAVIRTLLGVVILLTLVACSGNQSSNRDTNSSNTDFPEFVDPFDDTQQANAGGGADAGSGRNSSRQSNSADGNTNVSSMNNWSILLATFSRDQHEEQAQRIRQEFIEISGMSDAWIESTTDRSVLRYGRYESYSSRAAQRDLERIKNVAIGSARPFEAASLSPIGTGEVMGHYPQFNLINVREQFPNYDEIYTLQIGRYAAEQETTREEAQKLAEQAVMQLRTTGEMAYYYHGPRMSLVCVGLFFGPVIDPAIQTYTPEVKALCARFPNNSYNGRVINRKMTLFDGTVKDLGPEPSFPVEVPRKQR
ncbi:MAG: hypothetical protein D8M59_02795 [Planctomycetes bacterium]|nr:hypothetical protein [Planctomycetota bacterium]NOG52923.1 hypothetical protein [Planctomycetota bacterium]